MATFDCKALLPEGEFEAKARITSDALMLRDLGGRCYELSFADLLDMRLLNYRVCLTMGDYEAQIFWLGHQTEEFFEELWEAYEKRSCKALFVEGAATLRVEGDYAYAEPGGERHGIAKLRLYPDCLCILPHDAGARRVPLCFCERIERTGFSLSLVLDTGERYRIARLGGNTDPFFARVRALRDEAARDWREAHRVLDESLASRLGWAQQTYDVLRLSSVHVVQGLFDARDEAFWIAGIGAGRAALELVCGEKTALYLYEFRVSPQEFEARLRHALEATKTNRRVVYVSDEELRGEPLYRMAVARSSHVRFLRACNVGRIVHVGAWHTRLAEFLRP